MNPLHMACIYSAFCNGGNVIKPYLVYQKDAVAEYWIPGAFSNETASRVLEGTKKVVNDSNGTGYAAHRDDILLAGKTGTAEIKASKDDTSGTELEWFAIFTAEDTVEHPILIISMVEDVKGRGGSGYPSMQRAKCCLIKKEVYPEFDKNNFMDMYRKKELDNLVETLYTAQPKIFTGLNDDNKKIMIHLLQLIMDNSNKPELFEVLQQVIDLDEDEIKELAEVLKYTTLNNITKVIKLLQDRLKVIQGLKEIVFDDKQFAREVEHIQEVVEKHYWLFGEQYNLITAAEPDFELALKGLLIATKGDDSKVIIDHEDKNKEMDIYMIRQDRRGNVTENVVVELKRPTVPLGEEQLSQVKKYMRVIKSDDRFNASNVKWTYFLVGNRLNKNGYIQDEIEGHKTLGEPHLVHADSNGNNKIYVLTWSDIFDEFSLRHEYLMRKLELEKEIWLKKHDSIENVVEDIKDNSAT